MVEIGFLNMICEIWWDVWLYYNFGMVEVCVCDIFGSLMDVFGIIFYV